MSSGRQKRRPRVAATRTAAPRAGEPDDARASVASAGPVAQSRLEELYGASKVLARFERVDHAVTAVLEIVTRSIRLHTAVLIVAADTGARTFVWPADDAHSAIVREATAHANEAYAYLSGDTSRGAQPGSSDHQLALPHQTPSATRARVPHGANYIALPLAVDRSPAFGVFQLEGAEVLDEADVRFAGALTDQLAVALARHIALRREQSAREEAEEAAERLRHLKRVSEAALLGVTVEQTLQRFVPAVREVFGVDAVGVLLPNEDGAALHLRASVGLADVRDARCAPGDAALGRIAATARAQAFDDLRDVDDDGALLRRNGMRSMMGAPLVFAGRVRGVVCTASRALRHFSGDDAQLLQLIAGRLVLLLEHSRLYDAERGLTRQLEAISRSFARIGSLGAPAAVDLTAVLQASAEEARAVTDADYAALGLGNDAVAGFELWAESAPPLPPGGTGALERPREPVALLRAIAHAAEAVRTDAPRAHAAFGQLGGAPAGPVLGVPIRRRGASVGAVCLVRRAGRPAFTAHDERVIELLATLAAIAVENARLYDVSQRAVRAREDVLAVVSHDLRNPLATIMLNVGIGLRATPPEERGAFGRRQLEAIHRAAQRMDRMIHDLLDAATIEAGRFAVEPRPNAVESMVREAVEVAMPLATARSLRLVASVGDDLPAVRCDRDRVLQVLSNLLVNAIKFTPEGGEIVLAAERAGGDVRMAVRDTGPGISADDVPHLFDRYWRARESDRRGTGLGLYISRGIIEAHGRTLEVASALGQGTTFTFTLPAA